MGSPWSVAANWYRAVRLDDRVTRIDEPHVVPLLRCNMWHVRGRDRNLVVDGGLGLWDRRSRMLLAGNAVYDGPLLDQLPGSDIVRYVATMERLRRLPAEVVHAGHDASFDGAHLRQLSTAYLALRGA